MINSRHALGVCALAVVFLCPSPGATVDIYTCNNSVSEYWTIHS